MRRFLSISTRLVLVSMFAVLIAACDDDPAPTGPGPAPPDTTAISGRVFAMADGSSLEGVKVALVRALPFEVAGAVAETDTGGAFAFENPTPGDYYLFVYPREYLTFDALQVLVSVRKGDLITRDLALFKSELWADTPPLASGVIRDGGTGAPVEGALVSSAPGFFTYGWQGITLPEEDITDAQGRYTVRLQRYQPSNRGTLIVSKEGYNTFFVDSLLVPDPPDTMIAYDVNLKTGGPSGNIAGRVVAPGDTGVAGVPVGIALIAGGQMPAALQAAARYGVDGPELSSILGKTVLSGSDGGFTITGITPGTYVVVAGYLPDDGYGLWDALVTVVADEENLVGDIEVLPVIVPISPMPGATVAGPRPTLRWEAVPGATEYRVIYGTGHLLLDVRASGNEWQFPADLAPGTMMRWGVNAPVAGQREHEFDVLITFTVAE